MLKTVYIANNDNILADAASRNQMTLFHERMQEQFGHAGIHREAPRSLQRVIRVGLPSRSRKQNVANQNDFASGQEITIETTEKARPDYTGRDLTIGRSH